MSAETSLIFVKKRGEWKKAKKISVFKNHNKVKWEEVDMILYKKLTEIKISHTEKYRGILTEDSLNMIRTDIMVRASHDSWLKRKRKYDVSSSSKEIEGIKNKIKALKSNKRNERKMLRR